MTAGHGGVAGTQNSLIRSVAADLAIRLMSSGRKRQGAGIVLKALRH